LLRWLGDFSAMVFLVSGVATLTTSRWLSKDVEPAS